MNYWEKFYNDSNKLCNKDLQKNVGRTINGIAINAAIWKKTIKDIRSTLSLKQSDDLLELCCGNGQIIGNLVNYCNSVVGVDFSKELLTQLMANYSTKIITKQANVLNLSFRHQSFDVIIIYFSIQHFTEKETILLIQKSIQWLKNGGRLLIGDIPNEITKWNYMNKPQYKKDYLERVLNNKPKIGSWFHPDFFLAINDYFDSISLKIIKQKEYQFNAQFRFDVLIEKK